MDDDEEGSLEFVPLEVMPTMRLNDVVKNLNKPNVGVVNLDALIPPKEAGELVLKTLLYKIQPSVKVLSIRFNNLSAASIDYLIEWITGNKHLEMLYTMSCGLDDKARQKLEDAWKKNLTGHRKENMGFTFIRVTFEKEEEAKLLEA
jgi:hypothetical protein